MTYISDTLDIKAAAATDNVIRIKTDADTVATNLTRAELALLASEPHVNACVYSFGLSNLATNQSAVAVGRVGNGDLTGAAALRAGSVVGIAVHSSAGRTAGTAQFWVTKNGTTLGSMTATLNATDATYVVATAAKDASGLTFVAKDRIGVKVTTSTTWAPTTADISVDVHTEY